MAAGSRLTKPTLKSLKSQPARRNQWRGFFCRIAGHYLPVFFMRRSTCMRCCLNMNAGNRDCQRKKSTSALLHLIKIHRGASVQSARQSSSAACAGYGCVPAFIQTREMIRFGRSSNLSKMKCRGSFFSRFTGSADVAATRFNNPRKNCYFKSDVQNAQRLAPAGTADRQYGHSFVAGAAGGAGFLKRLTCLTRMKMAKEMIRKLIISLINMP